MKQEMCNIMKKQSQIWAVEVHRVAEMLRLPHSVDPQLTDAARLTALYTGHFLFTGRFLVVSFC
jgi:hypothetical protein